MRDSSMLSLAIKDEPVYRSCAHMTQSAPQETFHSVLPQSEVEFFSLAECHRNFGNRHVFWPGQARPSLCALQLGMSVKVRQGLKTYKWSAKGMLNSRMHVGPWPTIAATVLA